MPGRNQVDDGRQHHPLNQARSDHRRTLISAGVFRLIQIAWSPIALVGYLSFVLRLLLDSRRSGVSSTALASLYTRWMQHTLGTRRDEPAARLLLALPHIPHLGLRLTTAGTRLAHWLTGYVPRVYRYPYEGDPPLMHEAAARTTFFDAALARHLRDMAQLVVLGAGWDTRAYRMPPTIRCFEVDRAPTQQAKRQLLAKAGLDPTRIVFVPADLMLDDWLKKLVQAGFDPDRPTFFLWEAVTMYLDRAAVERALRTIAGLARGSVVAFDYFQADLITARSLYWRYARAVTNAIGEPFRFGIQTTTPARTSVAAFLAACGLSLEEQRNFGPETKRKPARAGFTTAIVT